MDFVTGKSEVLDLALLRCVIPHSSRGFIFLFALRAPVKMSKQLPPSFQEKGFFDLLKFSVLTTKKVGYICC